VSFDYLTESVITKTTGDAGVTTLVESFEAMGARWVSGIRDIAAFARELDLNVVEHFTTAELSQAYGIGRPLTSPIFAHYRISTLES
jgi:hypothetical protein